MSVSKGGYIKHKRSELKLKQIEVAKQVGITPEYLSMVENNHQTPSSDVLLKLSEVLNFNLDEYKKSTLNLIVSESKLPLLEGCKCGGFNAMTIDTYEKVDVPKYWLERGDFVIKVSGNSMKEYGIMDNSLVLIKKTSEFNNGDIVLLSNCPHADELCSVLKKVKISGKNTVFYNGQGEPLFLDENIKVEGVVISCMSDFK